RDLGAELLPFLELRDPLELGRERLGALRLDRRLVHARAVEVAELLLLAPRRRLRLRQALEDRVERLAIPLGQLGEGSPARELRGHGVLLHPAARGEAV